MHVTCKIPIFVRMTTQALQYLIALTQIPRVGSILAKNLLAAFGDAESVFKASAPALLRVEGIGEDTLRQILEHRDRALLRAEAEVEFMEKYQIQPLVFHEPEYPQRLRPYDDAPLVLYYKGNAALNSTRVVAIVGTRRPSEAGKAFCAQLVADLQEYNVLITSGLALGIDITAHRKAVELGVPNIGVVAHGLDEIYPPGHRRTAQEMVQNGGILTEFVSRTAPLQQNFPMRNRIIAGMADAVVVVETARTGGSMITAHFANEYQKDVFAVPGRVGDECSLGCNYLIKTHRAALIESAADIAYIMRWEKGAKARNAVVKPIFIDLSPDELRIYELLQQAEKGMHLDALIQSTQISTSRISVLLLELELKGVLRSLPGKNFVLA